MTADRGGDPAPPGSPTAMAPPHLALAVLVNAVWGLNFVAGKVAVSSFPAIFATGLRFLIVAVLLAPFLRLVPGQMRTIVLIAIFAGAIHFGMFFMGFDLASNVSVLAVVGQLNLPYATLIAVLFMGERIRWRRSLGIALAFGGVVGMAFDPAVFEEIEAVLLIAAAALSMAVAQNLMPRLKGVSPMNLQAWIALSSAPFLLLVSWPAESGQLAAMEQANWLAWMAIAYTAIGASVIGHGGMYYLINRYSVTLVAPMLVLAPIFGILFAVWLLGDELTLRVLACSAVTLVGVFIVAVREPDRAARRVS